MLYLGRRRSSWKDFIYCQYFLRITLAARGSCPCAGWGSRGADWWVHWAVWGKLETNHLAVHWGAQLFQFFYPYVCISTDLIFHFNKIIFYFSFATPTVCFSIPILPVLQQIFISGVFCFFFFFSPVLPACNITYFSRINVYFRVVDLRVKAVSRRFSRLRQWHSSSCPWQVI